LTDETAVQFTKNQGLTVPAPTTKEKQTFGSKNEALLDRRNGSTLHKKVEGLTVPAPALNEKQTKSL
jgi:hypothetical protein